MKRFQIIIILVSIFSTASAVNINHGGQGEALVLPYYSVNNSLNTLMTINNSTDMTKAVKIHFREGKEGKAVLTFNLFLGPYDMWAAGLVETASTIVGHTGEKTARLLYADGSCAPFLPSGQEFLPFEIDAESPDTDLARSTEGFIEIIEMGELDPSFGLGQDAVITSGVANDCASITSAYQGGVWDEINGDLTVEMLPVNGGLSATASVIDVAEGTMYSMDALALENFYPDDSLISHTSPGDTRVPSLDNADTSSVSVINGEPVTTDWAEGYQAVSALLMKYQVESFYDISPIADAKTEVIMSMPTKRFYEGSIDEAELPFTRTESESYNTCGSYSAFIYDRDASTNICTNDPFGIGCIANKSASIVTPDLTPIPPSGLIDPKLCFAVSVIQVIPESDISNAGPSAILGSQVFDLRDTVGFESGKLNLGFAQELPAPGGLQYHGLPILGYTLTKYTNAGAAEGLLAQYGGINKINYKSKVDSQQ